MKRIFGLFLMLILISGCIPALEQSEVMVKRGFEKIKEELQKDLGVEEYVMQVGDSITVDNKLVRLESFNADHEVVFDIEGHKVLMKGTREPLIVEDLELTILAPFTYNAVNMEDNYIKTKITKFVPEIDNYLFYLDDLNEILDHSIKLVKIEKSGTVVVKVDVVNEVRIMDDKTEAITNLYISNVRPVYRAIASERHVILKVVEKP